MLCNFLLLLCLVTPGEFLTVTHVPFGTIVVPRGVARTYSATVDVVIVRSHPRVASQHALNVLQEDLHYLLQRLRSWNDTVTVAETFKARQETLTRIIHTDMIQAKKFIHYSKRTSRNRRWAPLGFVGDISKGLFGTATTSDVEKLRTKLNSLISALQERDTVIQRNAIALDDTIAYTKQIAQAVQGLQYRVHEITSRFEILQRTVTAVLHAEVHLQAVQLTESILSLLEFYATQTRIFDIQYLHNRDYAEAGHLTESLVDRATLMKCLSAFTAPLPLEYIYEHTSVHLLRVNASQLAYMFQLPNTTNDRYTAWHIETIPFMHKEAIVILRPEVVDIALHPATGALIDTSDCQFENPLLCHSPVSKMDLPCIRSILGHQNTVLQHCLVMSTDTKLPIVRKATLDQVLLTTQGELIHERCLTKQPSTTQVQAGTYLLIPAETCTIEGNRWSFTRTQTTNSTVSAWMMDYMMPTLNLTNYQLEVETLPPLNWTHLKRLQEYTGHLPSLPRLSRLPSISSTNSYVAWTALSGVLFILIVGLGYIIERKYHCLQKCHRRPTKKVVSTAPPHAPAGLQPSPITSAETSPKQAQFPVEPRVPSMPPPLYPTFLYSGIPATTTC